MPRDFTRENGYHLAPGYTPYPIQDSARDPYVQEVRQRLLAQFTRRSSSPGQRPPSSSDVVSHGHSTFQVDGVASIWDLPPISYGEEPFTGHSSFNSAPPHPTPPEQAPLASPNPTPVSAPLNPSRRSSLNLPAPPPQLALSPPSPVVPSLLPPVSRQDPTPLPPTCISQPKHLPLQGTAPSLVRTVTVSNANKSKTQQSEPQTQQSKPQARPSKPHEQPSVHIVNHNNTTPKTMDSIRRSSRSRTGPTNYYDNEWYGVPVSISHTSTQFPTDTSTDREPTDPWSTERLSVNSTESPKLSTGDSSSRRRPKNIQKLLYGRELGHYDSQDLIYQTSSDFKPWKSWIGASNDVVVLAWSPDGTQFAAGAAAESDDHNMEYNRGNNLVVGNLQKSFLKELAGHWNPRPQRDGASSSSFNDPRLFKTVTAMQWFDDQLYTASFDGTVKIWDVHPNTAPSPPCLQILKHRHHGRNERVQVMARSNRAANILATGARSFRLWDTQTRQFTYLPLDLPRTGLEPTDLEPSALAWGHTALTNTYLVGGMAEKDSDDDQPLYRGHLALWKASDSSLRSIPLTSNSQTIFDVKWHPWAPEFLTASSESQYRARNSGIARDTHSMMRLYDPTRYKHRINEFPCPALDVNELTFCPMAPNYITASCTDGITYVWDSRNASRILHRLGHGEPLNPIDSTLPREKADVGVRVALWGATPDQLYSGASDGVIKRWDIRRASKDAFIENPIVLKEEIMCGALSEDKSNFLIGDAAGGIHVFSAGPCSDPENQKFKFERAPGPSSDTESNGQTGIQIANEYLLSGQLIMHETYGAGQGPRYEGPFARWARAPDTEPNQMRQTHLLPEHEIRQFWGTPVENRPGLSDDAREFLQKQIKLAEIRNRGLNLLEIQDDELNHHKRKRSPDQPLCINLCSDEEDESEAHPKPREPKKQAKTKVKKEKKNRRRSRPVITKVHGEIDLTADSETELLGQAFEDLKANLDEDYWWPESHYVDPNIHQDDV